MPFTKGNKYSTGRPKGIPNKLTGDIRNLIASFVRDNYEQFLEDFKTLSPNERCPVYLKAAQLIVPKPVAEKEETDKVEGIELRIVYPDGRVEVKKD